jgi:hypothetical protein
MCWPVMKCGFGQREDVGGNPAQQTRGSRAERQSAYYQNVILQLEKFQTQTGEG